MNVTGLLRPAFKACIEVNNVTVFCTKEAMLKEVVALLDNTALLVTQ